MYWLLQSEHHRSTPVQAILDTLHVFLNAVDSSISLARVPEFPGTLNHFIENVVPNAALIAVRVKVIERVAEDVVELAWIGKGVL